MALKVLVCDDERHIVRLIQVNLERQGWEVVTAYDGSEVLEKVKSESPDLVALDVSLPDIDGYEVLRRIRANPDTQDLPVIMLGAKSEHQDDFTDWDTSADMYMEKPTLSKDLIEFIRRFFRR